MAELFSGDSIVWNSAQLGCLLCAVMYLAAGAAVWWSPAQGPRKYSLMAACLVTSAWALVTAWNGNWLLGLEVEVLRAVAWLGFFAVSLGRWYRFSERELKIARGASFVLVPVLFPGSLMLFILLGEQTAFILACAAMILCNALALVLIENIFFNTRSDAGFGWKVVGGGACVIALFDLYMYSSLIFSDHVDFRIIISRSYIYAFVGLLLAFVSVSGWGLGRKFSLSRSAAFHSTALIGAGAYILLTSVGGELLRFRNNNWGPALELVFLAVALVVLTTTMTSAALRARMMVFISKHFFRLKYDYREVWVEFIRKMASPEERESLHERTLRALGNAIGCRNGMLWIFQSAIESYTAMAHWHVAENNDLISSEQGLPQFLLRTGWIVDIEQCLYDPDFYNGIVLPDGMSKQKDGWIIVPLIHRRVLEGFAVLGDPASRPNRLSWEDFDLLKMVGAQAASYLAEDRASRELVDALRVAEFNRRFSFMVHDIKNVVSQMAMMLQNAEKFGGDPEFQKDMLVTVGSSVDRLQRMLVSLGSQNGAKRPDVKPVELVELVHAAAQRWKHSYPRLMHRCDSGNMTVMASTERLDSVLDHLVQNAIEAAGPNGRVEVVLGTSENEAMIEVVDDGPGMSSEFVRDELFRPMATSKPNGSGIGAYQALRAVRDMGGRMEVQSDVNKGTTLRIKLPLKLA